MIEHVTNAPLADLPGILIDLVEEQTKTILSANHSRGYKSCTNSPAVAAPVKGAIFEREWILRHGYFSGGERSIIAAACLGAKQGSDLRPQEQ
jgi:hypothetical protein